jgi:predicted MFS family arabinose efflux permease
MVTPASPPRPALLVYAAAVLATLLGSSSAPTPFYRLYQAQFGLSTPVLTLIFAVYALTLLGALLTVGSLSDHLWRRPVLAGALVVNAAAMAIFMTADSGSALILARAVQGIALGAAIATVGAILLDADRTRGPLLNSVTPMLGLSFGALGAGLAVTYATEPGHLVYGVLLAMTVAQAAALLALPETAPRRPGALASLRPRIHVPPAAMPTLIRITPVNISMWGLGGFFLSLGPSMIRAASHLDAPLVGAAVVSALPFTAALAIYAMRNRTARVVLIAGSAILPVGTAVILGGVALQSWALLLLGAVVSGVGFGCAFSGMLRTLLPLAPPEQRAGLLSAFYVEAYLAFGLPAIAAGLAAPRLGLIATTYIYGGVLSVLALVSLVAISRRPAPDLRAAAA